MQELSVCGPVRLLNIAAEQPGDWPVDRATHIRVSLPVGQSHTRQMLELGFFPAERMLDVTVIPARTKLDYAGLVRIQPELLVSDQLTRTCREELLTLARQSFPTDRRFHVAPAYNSNLANIILESWVADLSEVFVCRVKGDLAGFLALRREGDRAAIHLAAVLEKYRTAGVALSLYAGAISQARTQGVEVFTGCISTANTAVMNLYAHLGGVFSNPRDIFLKEVEHVALA